MRRLNLALLQRFPNLRFGQRHAGEPIEGIVTCNIHIGSPLASAALQENVQQAAVLLSWAPQRDGLM
ncbi:hypothetical protein GCM10010924_52850 [Rhizobium wenxiniae]|nr:hypothetical protein GCM10010924_52850 [Rhizobium wenxiniae]